MYFVRLALSFVVALIHVSRVLLPADTAVLSDQSGLDILKLIGAD